MTHRGGGERGGESRARGYLHAETTSFTSATILCLCLSFPPNPPTVILHPLPFLALLLPFTFLPLSFALRRAATADLNNSAQAGILQGPIVCAWQENEKERDKERRVEKGEKKECRAVCACVNGKWRETEGRRDWKVHPAFFYLVVV